MSTLEIRRRGELGEVLDRGTLAMAADEFARTRRAVSTRMTYAGVYKSLGAFLGPGARVEDLTPEAVLRYREQLELRGFTPATVAKQLAAIRQLAVALDVQGGGRVKSQPVDRGEPHPMERKHFEAPLRAPDCRTTRGKRDLALLHLLGTVGLRRQEAVDVKVADISERRRAPDGRLRRAIAGSTSFWLTVRYGKRGKLRSIPLEAEALEAIEAWFRARPVCGVDELLVSLPRRRRESRKLGVRDVGRIVGHYGEVADVPEDRRTPHTLRHTFCTHLIESGVSIEVVKELAGHEDISTTQIYAAVSDHRLQDAIELSARARRGGLRSVGSR